MIGTDSENTKEVLLMPTISAAANNAYTMYMMTESMAGTANPAQTDAAASPNATDTKTADGSASGELADVFSSASSALSLSSLRGVSSGAAALVQSYDDARTTLLSQYGAAMTDLRATAREVARTKFGFSASDAVKKETGVTVYSDGVKQAIKSVQSLVADRNDALGVTSEYKGTVSWQDKTFPSIDTMSGTRLRQASAYTNSGVQADAIGRMLDSMV